MRLPVDVKPNSISSFGHRKISWRISLVMFEPSILDLNNEAENGQHQLNHRTAANSP